MKLFKWSPDGGAGSGVQGLFIVEMKPLFSIVLLRFNRGTREAYHSHAFNAVTLWLWGKVVEHHLWAGPRTFRVGMLKYTPRSTFHKIEALTTTWALSVRGPWRDSWRECCEQPSGVLKMVTLTHGRQVVA